MTDREYLLCKLESLDYKIKELMVEHRIHLAEFNLKRDLLHSEIDSIKTQLDTNKGDVK